MNSKQLQHEIDGHLTSQMAYFLFLSFFFLYCCSCLNSEKNPKNRRRHSRKTEPESEESDSDQDPLTSSRTESSNQLDGKIKHSKCEIQA